MFDYVAGKAAWLAEGLPGEGLQRDEDRAGPLARADVPRLGPDGTIADVAAIIDDWELVAVLGDGEVVVGVARREVVGGPREVGVAKVMQTAPPTVRPSIPRRELVRTMQDDGLEHVLVTTAEGVLIGLVRLEDLVRG